VGGKAYKHSGKAYTAVSLYKKEKRRRYVALN